MKLYAGCGDHPKPGYTNIDLHNRHADILGDIRSLTFERVDEIRCEHLLEHIPMRDVPPLLERMHGWMNPDGRLMVEVPDMETIMQRGAADSWWQQYIYGSQEHDGEYHRSGFTAQSLKHLLEQAGWRRVVTRRFLSDLMQRPGMPCLSAEAVA